MSEFANVLRSWRDRVRPEEVGLPAGAGRRTPGLRREELAALAGVSVDYVVRLEQGRARHPSDQVATALARALQLDDAERDHLFRSAGLLPPTSAVVSRHIPPGVQRLVARLRETPVAVFSASWDLLTWSPLWGRLLGDPEGWPADERNIVVRAFRDARREADKLLSDARSKAEEVTREARAKADALERDARQRHQEAMGGLDAKRSALQKHIEELKQFEREYRTRLKSYLESQLRDLDVRGDDIGPRATNSRQPATAGVGQGGGRFLEDEH